MKITIKLMVLLITIFAFAESGFSYVFTYSNHTNKTLSIKIQLAGAGEPWYYLGPDPYKTNGGVRLIEPPGPKGAMLPPNKAYEFRFELFEDPPAPPDYARKFWFCMGAQQYSFLRPAYPAEPTHEAEEAALAAPKKPAEVWETWTAIEPKFIPSDAYNKLIDASSKLAEGLTRTAGAILKGVGTVAGAAAGAEAGQPIAGAQLGGVVGEVVSEVPIGNIIQSIGEIVSSTPCKSRHYDIVEGDDGKGIQIITYAK